MVDNRGILHQPSKSLCPPGHAEDAAEQEQRLLPSLAHAGADADTLLAADDRGG